MKAAWDSTSDQASLRKQLEADFSQDEIAGIFQLVNVPASEITWEPSPEAARQRRRGTALDEAAKRLGFETWRRFETAVINGDRVIVIDPRDDAPRFTQEAAELRHVALSELRKRNPELHGEVMSAAYQRVTKQPPPNHES